MHPGSKHWAPLLERLGRPSRRTLLRWAALTGLGMTVLGRPALADGEDPPPTLDPAVAQALEAACARILPSSDGPGAREAKVLRFIDLQLAGPLQAIRPAMLACASLLDQWARARYGGKVFAGLAEAEQDFVLGQLSRGGLQVTGFPQREVFKALHSLTLEGFLSDPVHGGNHQQLGWKALGIAAPHRRTRAEAQEEDQGAGHPAHFAPVKKTRLKVVE